MVYAFIAVEAGLVGGISGPLQPIVVLPHLGRGRRGLAQRRGDRLLVLPHKIASLRTGEQTGERSASMHEPHRCPESNRA